jgi:hypothetical protein
MGLDQYAYAACAVLPGLELAEGDIEKIGEWRKHNRLQGWMEALYRDKGGDAEVFNCVDVDITLDDLDALETAINGRDLPQTSGFFFGDDSYICMTSGMLKRTRGSWLRLEKPSLPARRSTTVHGGKELCNHLGLEP